MNSLSLRAKLLRSSLLCLLALACFFLLCGDGRAAQVATASGKVGKGEILPIYLSPAALAEAKEPTVTLLSPYGYQYPGPERYYGWALRDLRDYLQKMTGAQFPLTVKANADRGLFAGTFGEYSGFKPQSESARAAMSSNDPEAFIVQAQGNKIYLLGKTNFGLIAAVYSLLDKLGVKWYAPGEKWENVPQFGSWNFKNLSLASSGPSYQSRLMFSNYGVNSDIENTGRRETEVVLWMLRNRMGGSAYTQNIHNEEIIPRSLFETHPEYFAKVTQGPFVSQTKGGRLPRELARHKPEVVQAAVENIIRYFKENAGKGSVYDTYSVEPMDGISPDEEGIEKFGNATDLNFWFANQVAAGLEKAGYKDKWIGILSYFDHAAVPSFDLHPQVAVTLTTGLDTSSGMTVEERLDGFRRRKAQRLGIYEYFNVASWSLGRPGASPAGNAPIVPQNLKRWYDHGATVYMAESTDSWGDGGPGNYLLARFLWDVNADPKQELEAYFKGAYGPAAAEIKALYDEWNSRYGQFMPLTTRANLVKWHRLIEAADEKAKGLPVIQSRINDLKRYYLYQNFIREYELEGAAPRLPSRDERFWNMLRYVAANRGEGAFHARGLIPTLFDWARSLKIPFNEEKMGPALVALSKYFNDETALKSLPVYDEKKIDEMFAAAKLPVGAVSTNPAILDFALQVLPDMPQAPAVIRFPRMSGIPGGNPRQYVFKVLQPVPQMIFEVLADKANGGTDERTLTLSGENGETLQQLSFKVDEPVRFELKNVLPGVYTMLVPGFGAEQVTVRGGSTLGAMRAYDDTFGFNPYRPADLPTGEKLVAYFVVPAQQSSLSVALQSGSVSLGFVNGEMIVDDLKGSAELFKQRREFQFAPADHDRFVYVQWNGEYPATQGLVVRGVTLFSFDSRYVMYERLNQ